MKTKIAKLTAQQGDVNLRRLDKLPSGNKLPSGKIEVVSRKRLVLAEGEHTGHAHVIEDDDAELIRIGDRMILKLTKQATVVHEEHKPITLSPGIWEVGRVQEFDYFKMMQRQVQD